MPLLRSQNTQLAAKRGADSCKVNKSLEETEEKRKKRSKKRPIEKPISKRKKIESSSLDKKLVVDIFSNSQHLLKHPSNLKNLVNIFENCNFDEFYSCFLANAKLILQSDAKNPFTRHCIIFLTKFILTIENDSKKVLCSTGKCCKG